MNQKARRYFDQMIGAHEGRAAVIVCGGPSAPEQFKSVSKTLSDPVVISVNQHGCKLTRCDYSVSLDNIHDRMRDCDTVKICPYSWADIKLSGYWNAHNSGRTAVWCAYRMGCSPIVIIGADLYEGGTYFHDHSAHSSGRNVKLDGHLKEWEVLRSKVPEEIVTVAGGPLVEHGVLQKYDGRRKYPTVDYHPVKINREDGPFPDGTKVEITRPVWAEGISYFVGETPILRPVTARKLVSAGKAEYVN